MMHGFDRFDICEGYWLFYTLWHANGRTKRCEQQGRSIAEQLERLRFKPAPGLTLRDAETGAHDVYDALVERYHPGESVRRCPACDGEGFVLVDVPRGVWSSCQGGMWVPDERQQTCVDCDGEGKVYA